MENLQPPTSSLAKFVQTLEETSRFLETSPIRTGGIVSLVENLATAWRTLPLTERRTLAQEILTHRKSVIQTATALLIPQISSLNGGECARLSQSFAALSARSPTFYNALLRHVGENVWNFTNSELCASLAGGARIGLHNPAVTDNIVQRAIRERHTLAPTDLLNITSALADLEFRDGRVCSALALRAADILNEFQPRHLVALSRSLSIHDRYVEQFHIPACKIVASHSADLSLTELALFASDLTNLISYYTKRPDRHLVAVRESGLAQELTSRASRDFDSMDIPTMAHAALALSQLEVPDPRLFQRVSDRACDEKDSISGPRLVQLLIAFGRPSLQHLPLLDHLAAPLMKAIDSIFPHEFAEIANSYSHARATSTKILTSFADEAHSRINSFSARDVTSLALSFARSKIYPHPFWQSLQKAWPHLAESFTSTNLGELAWAYVKIGVPDQKFLQQIMGQVARMLRNRPGDISPKALANLAWAAKTVEHFDPKLIQEIALIATQQIRYLTSQGMTNIAEALAKFDQAAGRFISEAALLDSTDNKTSVTERVQTGKDLRRATKSFLNACATTILPKLHSFKPKELANLAWAYASLRCRQEDLFTAIAAEFVHRQKQANGMHHLFNGRDVANLAWAFATLNIPIADFAQEIATSAKILKTETTAHGARHTTDTRLRKSEPNISQRDLASVTWSLAILESSLVKELCTPDSLDSFTSPITWLQVYHALLVSEQISPHQHFERLAESIAQHGETRRSPFEMDMHDALCNVIGLPSSAIETGARIAGIEVDFILNGSVVLECDGSTYHLSRGPHGEVSLGPDVLQDRIFKLFGFDVVHIRSHEFRGSYRERDLARIREAVAPR